MIMKITSFALKKLIRESIKNDRIIPERPWSVEHGFKLSGGIASDSEGEGPDGFAIVLRGESGREMKVVVDTYWNPQSGDQSGNSLRVELDGEVMDGGETYVPTRFDDGKEQTLTISNSPVSGMITVSHSPDGKSPPIVYLVVSNPFDIDDDIDFDVEKLGNGDVQVQLKQHINL